MNKKKIEAAAQRCRAELHGGGIPVDVLGIMRRLDVHVVDNTAVQHLEGSELGKCITNGKTWVVIFDDTQPKDVARFTLGHELGHIYLDHCGQYTQFRRKQEQELEHFKATQAEKMRRLRVGHERQADEFARQLLCPRRELERLNVSSPQDIARLCKVPLSAARAL